MSLMKNLPDWARSALWIGGGAFVGLAVGSLLLGIFADALGEVVALAPLWILLALAYGGVILLVVRLRTRAAAPPAAPAFQSSAPATTAPRVASPRPAAPPVSPHGLAMEIAFPDVPPGHPGVMGDKDTVHVRVRLFHQGRPAEGGAVRLVGSLRDGARFVAGEGVTGTDGTITFTLKPRGTGELLFDAEARFGELTGTGAAVISIVRYEEEIERLFGEFRAFATAILGPDSHAATPRELAEGLRVRAKPDAARALLELARIYELVAYGERDADRSLYLALVAQLLVLEGADMPPSATHPHTRTVGG